MFKSEVDLDVYSFLQKIIKLNAISSFFAEKYMKLKTFLKKISQNSHIPMRIQMPPKIFKYVNNIDVEINFVKIFILSLDSGISGQGHRCFVRLGR